MQLKSLLGADISDANNVEEDYEWASSLGYSFILANLYKNEDRFYDGGDSRTDVKNGLNFIRVKNNKIAHCVVGKISSWIDLDSDLESFRKVSKQALIEELEWAIFQGLPAVVIKIKRKNNPNLARVLSSFISNEHMYFTIWLSIPVVYESELEEIDEEHDYSNTWEWWKQFSILMGEYVCNFKIMLTLPSKISKISIKQWLSEPIAAIDTPTKIYLTNRAGYPVLSTYIQDIICIFFKYKVQIVISGEVQNPRGYLSYYQYIAHLWKNRPPLTIYEKNSKDMEDHLQDPLQPLADHLPNITYSIFEMDPYKYRAYEEAIEKAIIDLFNQSNENSKDENVEELSVTKIDDNKPDIDTTSENQTLVDDKKELEKNEECCDKLKDFNDKVNEKDICFEECDSGKLKVTYASVVSNTVLNGNCKSNQSTKSVVIMVLGAGRGPLVDCAFRAGDRLGCQIVMHIVEKNPNAVNFLRNRIREDWSGRKDITLHSGDMRDVKLPELADIFVSELLGSFGDNELSPECLDGVQKYLKPNGISIPSNYTSYISPIQSTKLHCEMANQKPSRKAQRSKFTSLETPYVVNLKNFRHLSEIRELFTFKHPKPDITESNDRYAQVTFEIKETSIVHGFAGYFHSLLYKDVYMSIHPEYHSPDMFSWFPLLFPVIQPIQVSAGSTLVLHMWRVSDNNAVWYEWACSEPITTPIHNPGGRSYSMSLHTK